MADDIEKPRLLQIAELLERHAVEFVVIGGQAAALHGSPIPTYDVDLCYQRTAENLARLSAALQEIHPTLLRIYRSAWMPKASLWAPT